MSIFNVSITENIFFIALSTARESSMKSSYSMMETGQNNSERLGIIKNKEPW